MVAHFHFINYPLLASDTQTPSPEATYELEGLQSYSPTLDYNTYTRTSTSTRAIWRQTPEVGTQCGHSARWDLCGGHPKGRSLPQLAQMFLDIEGLDLPDDLYVHLELDTLSDHRPYLMG